MEKKYKLIAISTKIPEEEYRAIKAAKVKLNNLILLGWRAYRHNPQMIERISELERKQVIYSKLVQQYGLRLVALERGGRGVVEKSL